MSTNYYIKGDQCEHCKRSDPDLHIGKSSFGWAFALHVVADRGLNSLDDWRPLLAAGRIIDEYDDPVSAEKMLQIITERPADCRRNGIDGRHCIGHGAGTWDLLPCDFS